MGKITAPVTFGPDKQAPKNSTAEKVSIWQREIELRPSFGSKEKQRFFQLLGVLLESRLGISEALEVIYSQQKKRLHRQIVGEIVAALLEGLPLSEALALQTRYFSEFERFSIAMGEQSGQMAAVLADLAAFHEKRLSLQRKLVQAFSYPIVVIFIAGGVLFFMINFVVPMFKDIFARFDAELPAITQTVLSLSEFSSAYGSYILLLFLIIAIAFFRIRKQNWFQRFSGQVLLRLPLFGNIIRKVQLSRFCYSMSLMLRSKVSLDQTLDLLAKVTTFDPLRRTIAPIQKEIVEGKTLHEALQKHPVFPVMLLQMVRVGERTARLDAMLEQVAKNYEAESETGISTLTSLLEPILIVVLGLLVGIILISMYLPMFELSNTFL